MIPHVKPVFPTEDYPVWTSMATGMQFYLSNQGSNYFIALEKILRVERNHMSSSRGTNNKCKQHLKIYFLSG